MSYEHATRSRWNGSLGTGLVTLEVKLGPSVDSKGGPELHQVRKSDGSPIRIKRVAEADGEEVEWSEIGKGYDAPGGPVILDSDDFKKAYGDCERKAEVVMFADPSDVPAVAHQKSYWVIPGHRPRKSPEAWTLKNYAALVKAMEVSGKVAVARFAIDSRMHYALLQPSDRYLVLTQLSWAEDLYHPGFEAPEIDREDPAVDDALEMIGAMSGSFTWEAETDKSRENLEKVIQDKLEGRRNESRSLPVEVKKRIVLEAMGAIRENVNRKAS